MFIGEQGTFLGPFGVDTFLYSITSLAGEEGKILQRLSCLETPRGRRSASDALLAKLP
ncbi:MAG: hypothetical protein OJF52_004664 [Nitrospira sp.]|nr:MAG: hypothetical protein OJF52_004664 [Nitrospira sp.]